MEKLIELLNEFDENWKIGKNGLYKREEYEPMEEYIISKNFGFIKWLVENEKIKWNEKFYLEDDEGLFGTYECILMQLAIQDEPIEFLVSILK